MLTVSGRAPASLSRVAHTLGFSSHSHFVRAMRRGTGMTPGAARALLFWVISAPPLEGREPLERSLLLTPRFSLLTARCWTRRQCRDSSIPRNTPVGTQRYGD